MPMTPMSQAFTNFEVRRCLLKVSNTQFPTARIVTGISLGNIAT